MSTFNRLQPPAAPPEPAPQASSPVASSADAVAAMFPPQAPNGYLADALGVPLTAGPMYEGSLTDLTAPEVLCNHCVHGHVLKSRAATQNRKPDGSPFYFLFGQCLRVSPPMSLDDLRVEHCNQFKPVSVEDAQ